MIFWIIILLIDEKYNTLYFPFSFSLQGFLAFFFLHTLLKFSLNPKTLLLLLQGFNSINGGWRRRIRCFIFDRYNLIRLIFYITYTKCASFSFPSFFFLWFFLLFPFCSYFKIWGRTTGSSYPKYSAHGLLRSIFLSIFLLLILSLVLYLSYFMFLTFFSFVPHTFTFSSSQIFCLYTTHTCKFHWIRVFFICYSFFLTFSIFHPLSFI